MIVKITSKAIVDLKNSQFDLDQPIEFKAFLTLTHDLLESDKEFKVLEIKERVLYVYNLNQH